MKYLSIIILLSTSLSFAGGLSDTEIRKILVAESLSQYGGPCPCPYNTMRNGRSCGRRSAYSKPGGYSPLCYPSDVSSEMIKNYKRNNSK